MSWPLNKALRALVASGVNLEAKTETMASAALFFHRFCAECHSQLDNYDPLLLAATCIYLAGKVEEDNLRIRDIINVFYLAANPSSEPLELDDDYWSLRDSIVQFELLLLRVLRFRVANHKTPHRYLLHYLRALAEWMADKDSVRRLSLTAWSLLNDFYLDPRVLDHPPHHLAVAIIELSLQSLDMKIPYNDEALLSWNEALCESLSKDKMNEIIEQVISGYDENWKEAQKDQPSQAFSFQRTN